VTSTMGGPVTSPPLFSSPIKPEEVEDPSSEEKSAPSAGDSHGTRGDS